MRVFAFGIRLVKHTCKCHWARMNAVGASGAFLRPCPNLFFSHHPPKALNKSFHITARFRDVLPYCLNSYSAYTPQPPHHPWFMAATTTAASMMDYWVRLHVTCNVNSSLRSGSVPAHVRDTLCLFKGAGAILRDSVSLFWVRVCEKKKQKKNERVGGRVHERVWALVCKLT